MVWSDQAVQKLAQQFVVVADEVYVLYPEDPANLARVADDPAHRFFKSYGESMPKGSWQHPGTKQGIYMMGPDGEYLEGHFATSGNPRDIEARLQRALERWEELRKKRKYANRPVPAVAETAPPDVAASKLILRASLRDLPRQPRGDDAPVRWRRGQFDDQAWPSFIQWAWNQNWIGFADPRPFVTTSKSFTPVDDEIVRRICREVLVDNVRGQAPWWRNEHVQQARLTVRRTAAGPTWRLEYEGEARMVDGDRSFAARLRGEAEWDPKQACFVRFELLALGDRRGAATTNQRNDDPGPAPLGIALRLFTPAPVTGKARTK